MPATVAPVVAIPRTELPEPTTEPGVKVGVAPAGKPLTANETLPPKPSTAETVAVKLVLAPAATVCDAGEAASVKSGCNTVYAPVVIPLSVIPLLVAYALNVVLTVVVTGPV